jgi:hypothetical protein
MTYARLFLLLLLLPATMLRAQTKGDDLIGKWISESGKAKVEIFLSSGKYYGKIVWLKNPLDNQGEPKTDTNNPDPASRSRKIMGLLLLKSFVFDGKQWDHL